MALTDSLPRSTQNLRVGAVTSTGSSAPVSNWLLRVQRAQSVYGSMFQRSRSDSFIAPFRGRALSPFFIECIYVTEVIKQKCSGEVPAMTSDLSEAYVWAPSFLQGLTSFLVTVSAWSNRGAGWHVTPRTQHTRVNIIFTSHDLFTIISIKASAALHCGTEGISSKTPLSQRKPEEMVKPSLLSKLLRKSENIQCRLKMEELLSLFTAHCVSNMEVQNKLSIQHKSKC